MFKIKNTKNTELKLRIARFIVPNPMKVSVNKYTERKIVKKNQEKISNNLKFLINLSLNFILPLITSEIFRKLKSNKTEIVIIRINSDLNPILIKSNPINVGTDIIKHDKIRKSKMVNFFITSSLK